ncbi:lipopolysaccharide assembly protein LapB [Methylococcus capsulatus]|jgi:lipopolysaccharide biosynthesis regulator YciM|uniref:Lipopolysaccharide assembly protein B n=2 Tax=Methylococcaceae TaxID=403 RepID=A0AA35XWC1_METCP|nr:lipopolysaccharide assembly protein LapB [Methylococcus capsulatus]CAI8888405.1 Lipopolysaccharide assembly protein B [Methylococcus capsulatus]
MSDVPMLELLTLLLPVAAASGWYAAARHHGRNLSAGLNDGLQRAYQTPTDTAIGARADEAFHLLRQIADSSAKTLELQLALGGLLRRSGELSKAIELHERLHSQPQMSDEQLHAIRFELGMDYLSAGLLDRAETVFAGLTATASHGKASLQQMLAIYQSEKDWVRAAECARSLKKFDAGQRNATLAHLLCEQAESAIARGETVAAHAHLQQALAEDPRCVRATLLKSRLALQRQQWAEAGTLLRSVEFQNPAFLPEVIGQLRLCHASLRDMDGYLTYLDYVYQRYRTEAAALLLADELAQREGAPAAASYLTGLLSERSSLNLIRRTLHYAGAATCIDGDCLSILRRCLTALDGLASRHPGYGCVQCGYECRELHWHCPTCRAWETIQPADPGVGFSGKTPATTPS